MVVTSIQKLVILSMHCTKSRMLLKVKGTVSAYSG